MPWKSPPGYQLVDREVFDVDIIFGQGRTEQTVKFKPVAVKTLEQATEPVD